MKSLISKLLAVVLLAGLGAQANAGLVSNHLGDVWISGHLWTVSFVQSEDGTTSFDDVFGHGVSPALTFTNVYAAYSAVREILDILPASFDVTPAHYEDGFRVAYADDEDTYEYVTGFNRVGPYGPFVADRGVQNNVFSFAVFSEPNVPEPATVALLGLGLVGLGLRRRLRA